MTSLEIVSRAIEFRHPERLPMYLFVSGPSDVQHVSAGTSSDPRESRHPGTGYTDHFGCRFDVRNELTMGQPCGFPIPDLDRLDSYRFPDPEDEVRLAAIGDALEASGDQYVVCDIIWFTFFERMHFLHGFAPTMEDLLLRPRKLQRLADRVIEYDMAAIRALDRHYHSLIHGIVMSDDWGSQAAAFIGRELFRGFFLPRYRALFGLIRELGMHVWLHSCGNVLELIPSFIDAGVQVLNLQQPRVFDLAELSRRFAGSVCFNLPVDIQSVMPHGSRQDIQAEARELVRRFALPAGGLIASEHPDYQGNGIDPEKGVWAYEAFREADPYQTREAAPRG